jgi:hypothetical protein
MGPAGPQDEVTLLLWIISFSGQEDAHGLEHRGIKRWKEAALLFPKLGQM